MMKKIIIISFLLIISIQPIANANITVTNYDNRRLIQYSITEFKIDGSLKKTYVNLTLSNLTNLIKDHKETNSFQDRFKLLQKYSFIPKDVSHEQIRIRMEENSKNLKWANIDINDYYNTTHFFKINNNAIMNSKCSVTGEICVGIRTILGLSSITRVLNWIIRNSNFEEVLIPSLDLLIIQMGLIGIITTENGTSPDSSIIGFPILCVLIGFIGYYITIIDYPMSYLPLISIPGLLIDDLFIGYSSYIAAFSLFDFNNN